MSLAHHWRSQQFKPSRRDVLLAALIVLVSVSVLARAIVGPCRRRDWSQSSFAGGTNSCYG